MPAHVAPVVRTGLVSAVLAAGLAGPLAGTAAAGCVDLRGAAAQMFDRNALCRNLRAEVTSGRPDLDRALRGSVRGARAATGQTAERPARKAAPAKQLRAARSLKTKRMRAVARRAKAMRAWPMRAESEAVRKLGVPSGHIGNLTKRGPARVTPPPARPERAPALVPTATAAPAASTAPTEGGVPQSVLMVVVAAMLLVTAFVVQQRAAGPVPATGRPRLPRRRPQPAAPEPAPAACAVATVTGLARPTGLGVTGPGADGFVRAVLVGLLTGDVPPGFTARTKVVTTAAELDRLFDGGLDEPLRQALAPRLHVCDLLEETIEHLELEMLMADAERANPDLSPTGGRDLPTTYWICTPGQDDDVVLPLVRRGPAHRLVGLMFGRWPHGRNCVVDAAGVVSEAGVTVTAPTPAEALAQLRAHTARERGDWA